MLTRTPLLLLLASAPAYALRPPDTGIGGECTVYIYGYVDDDQDGYGTGSYGRRSICVNASANGDCDDTNYSIYPGATERCNGDDDDCDGGIDEGLLNTYYRDVDGDGYGSTSTTSACSRPSGYVSTSGDCNDGNAAIRPGYPESCNSVDDDCDGSVDEGVQTTYYKDFDGDGYGTSSVTSAACSLPSGYATSNTDCNDSNSAVRPGATEVCNGVDDDCDSSIDEGVKVTYYRDADSDGHGTPNTTTSACSTPSGYVAASDDCNDSVASIYTGAQEVCDAGNTDEDCDTLADDNDPSASSSGKTTFYVDSDADTYGATTSVSRCDQPSGYTNRTGDCNDASSAVNPGVADICNGIDDNCNGSVDETSNNTFYRDTDSDGYGVSTSTTTGCSPPSGYASQSGDCNDGSASIKPGATELVGDAVDQNCDGAELCYKDTDDDGYRLTTTTSSNDSDCSDTGEALSSDSTGDCNDSSSAIRPGASESAGDQIDQNCDGQEVCYKDADDDGYRPDATSTTVSTANTTCGDPGEAVSSDALGDCNDASSSIRPGATEQTGDSVDQNCDGAEVCWRDADNDGYRPDSSSTTNSTNTSCADPNEATSADPVGDCNDSNAAVSPGDAEVCDDSNVDEDCDGNAEDADTSATGKTAFYADSDADGYGNPASSSSRCDANATYSLATATDCDDTWAAAHPGGTEACDSGNHDEDCDGRADDDDAGATGTTAFYPDTDGDSYGGGSGQQRCDAGSGQVSRGGDCNDGSASISPAVAELCDAVGVDEDCDGLVDDLDSGATGKLSFYADADADGYGAGNGTARCDGLSGEVLSNGDCNDANTAISPGDAEICDTSNIDEDCDGLAEDADSNATGKSPWYADADGDGIGGGNPAQRCDAGGGYTLAAGGDCNDNDASVGIPQAAEVCDAGNVDEDCDGLADNADPSAQGTTSYYTDGDGDGFGANGSLHPRCDRLTDDVSVSGDCDDALASTNPGATEICDASNRDEDCDGGADDLDAAASGKVRWYVDADDDGFGIGAGTLLCDAPSGTVSVGADCDDADDDVNPGATEVCDPDDIDEDCDGGADDLDSAPVGTTGLMIDADRDGYGTGAAVQRCDPTGTRDTSLGGDCDDATGTVNPGMLELCDEFDRDEDCDGFVDDADASVSGRVRYYDDLDSDGFGDVGDAGALFCDPLALSADVSGDCDDADAALNPGNAELCDSGDRDEDCDGLVDDDDGGASGQTLWYADADADGFGDAGDAGTMLCDLTSGSSIAGDCNDADTAFYPGAAETDCNDPNDYNCDGSSGDDDVDVDGYSACVDCDDGDRTMHPGAAEVCDPQDRDEDCDGLVDDGDSGPIGQTRHYQDADADGYGSKTDPGQLSCNGTAGSVSDHTDCDDTRYNSNPGAPEVCDASNRDEDCDGLADNFDSSATGTVMRWPDTDHDGYGSESASPTVNCDPATGAVSTGGDCDDGDADVHPGQAEIAYDGVDQDCVGGDAVDLDGDGYRAYEAGGDDCVDFDAGIHPDLAEVANGIDDDCNGYVDDGTPFADADGDGYSEDGGDCDDANADVGPAMTEECNGVDDDCDFAEDEETECFDDDGDGYAEVDGDCDDGALTTHPGAVDVPEDGRDNDCDGTVDDSDADGDGYTGLQDCDDGDGGVHPGAEELGDGVDQDCDGTIDEGTDLFDDDGDGYTETDGDCDDTNPDRAPGLTETIDGVDQDCDGLTDDGTDAYDDDADGFTEQGGDCDDADPAVSPGEVEEPNGIDDDCDAAIDEGIDADGDGYAFDGGDCDDDDPGTNPAANEDCGDGADNDCDGSVDEACASADDDKKCGCDGAGGGAGWLAMIVGALGMSRRRR